ncbi:hypothetical protein [Yimella sp. cx-51]|nr:hypothetical protein [Yimella sp. cx-51]MBC9955962.1 hypothetical protein [Yimella sp. cx-51]QTH37498.1 hypothetical protein J5M86_11530 [Yimella sp. cx-51]
MRYSVTISTPNTTYTYNTDTTDANGCVTARTTHVVEVVGGSWTYSF